MILNIQKIMGKYKNTDEDDNFDLLETRDDENNRIE